MNSECGNRTDSMVLSMLLKSATAPTFHHLFNCSIDIPSFWGEFRSISKSGIFGSNRTDLIVLTPVFVSSLVGPQRPIHPASSEFKASIANLILLTVLRPVLCFGVKEFPMIGGEIQHGYHLLWKALSLTGRGLLSLDLTSQKQLKLISISVQKLLTHLHSIV
ncbi:hypothetical protein Tco_0233461 [Tanacetum coccineum]